MLMNGHGATAVFGDVLESVDEGKGAAAAINELGDSCCSGFLPPITELTPARR